MSISVRRYTHEDEQALFSLIESEGEAWKCYFEKDNRLRYLKAIKSSVVYVLYDDLKLIGYARVREDDGFGVYVYDLLIDVKARGHRHGHRLMMHIKDQFPNQPLYVMSDVDPYYEKQGYQRVGSVFEVS